jgi:hypothetical protein
MEGITLFLSIAVTGFALLLLIVSTAAYLRLRNMKFIFVGAAFLTFFIKGILLIAGIVGQNEIGSGIDFVILILLYFAAVKK